jgi:hypothetical protein
MGDAMTTKDSLDRISGVLTAAIRALPLGDERDALCELHDELIMHLGSSADFRDAYERPACSCTGEEICAPCWVKLEEEDRAWRAEHDDPGREQDAADEAEYRSDLEREESPR